MYIYIRKYLITLIIHILHFKNATQFEEVKPKLKLG